LGSCEHGNEPLVSIKSGEFRNYHNDYFLLKDSASFLTVRRQLVTKRRTGTWVGAWVP